MSVRETIPKAPTEKGLQEQGLQGELADLLTKDSADQHPTVDMWWNGIDWYDVEYPGR